MSTFSGKIEEIPSISVDRFDESNLNSLAYFISHCHKDHMLGLDSVMFEKYLLLSDGVYLYASHVSVAILKLLCPSLSPKLKTLELDTPNVVKVKNDEITVTLISAGHCPGSVMFLFETDKTVLYTGDFRINSNDFKKFSRFYDSIGEIKIIDNLYLDTSFFDEAHLSLPRREDSLNQMCNVIKNWLSKNDNNIIEIITSARYGSEYLFIEIAKKFKMPIHVSGSAYNFYHCIPEMDNSITIDGSKTRIHSRCGASFNEICAGDSKSVLRIKPSVLIWTANKLKKGIVLQKKDGVYSVCYSCHASYEECLALIRFLKPKKIEPCVVPKNANEKTKMLDLIKEAIKEYAHTEKVSDKNLFTCGQVENCAVFGTPEKKKHCDNFILSSPCRPTKKLKL